MTVDYITPAYINPSFSNMKNLIIGGDFGTNPWQRGNSFGSAGSGQYTADRWVYYKSGSAVHTVQKTSDAPPVSQSNYFSDSCLELVCTTSSSSLGSNDYYVIRQNIEGYNFRSIAQQPFIVSFWVKAYKAGTYSILVGNSNGDRCYAADYTISTSATWQKISIPIPASPSSGSWNYTNSTGLYIQFVLACGTGNQKSPGSWQTSVFSGSTDQINGVDSTSDYFRLALVQIELGTISSAFDARSIQTELTLCLRYYQTFSFFIQGMFAHGNIFGTTRIVPMRTTPSSTITAYNLGPNAGGAAIYPADYMTVGYQVQESGDQFQWGAGGASGYLSAEL